MFIKRRTSRNERDDNRFGFSIALGISLGALFGMAVALIIGVMTGNAGKFIGIGISCGSGFGLAIGLAVANIQSASKNQNVRSESFRISREISTGR
ncbi:MAG: hypothetical protein ACE5I1_29060 [bacterium]